MHKWKWYHPRQEWKEISGSKTKQFITSIKSKSALFSLTFKYMGNNLFAYKFIMFGLKAWKNRLFINYNLNTFFFS